MILALARTGRIAPSNHPTLNLHGLDKAVKRTSEATRLIYIGLYGNPVFRDTVRGLGIIVVTPEYHGSYSGVLKNTFDLMGFDEFEGKMIGLLGVSGGAGGAIAALNSLRTVGRALHAWVVPEQVAIPHVDEVFDEKGGCTDRDIEKRLKSLGRQVAKFASLHNSEQAREFLKLWEGAPPNPGGEDR
jgi:hypothetical protein